MLFQTLYLIVLNKKYQFLFLIIFLNNKVINYFITKIFHLKTVILRVYSKKNSLLDYYLI